MKPLLFALLSSLALTTSLTAQSPPPPPPAPPAPAVSATVSPTTSPESETEQAIRRKHKKHFNFTIGDHDLTGGDSADGKHRGDGGDIPEMVVPIVAVVFLSIFGAPVLIVAVILYFGFSRNRMMHRTVRMINRPCAVCCANLLELISLFRTISPRKLFCAPTNTFAVFAAKPNFPPGFTGSPTIAFAKMRAVGRNWSGSTKPNGKASSIRRRSIPV